MEEHVEKILEKQLQRLSETSFRNHENYEALCALSVSMAKVITLLEGERANFPARLRGVIRAWYSYQ